MKSPLPAPSTVESATVSASAYGRQLDARDHAVEIRRLRAGVDLEPAQRPDRGDLRLVGRVVVVFRRQLRRNARRVLWRGLDEESRLMQNLQVDVGGGRARGARRPRKRRGRGTPALGLSEQQYGVAGVALLVKTDDLDAVGRSARRPQTSTCRRKPGPATTNCKRRDECGNAPRLAGVVNAAPPGDGFLPTEVGEQLLGCVRRRAAARPAARRGGYGAAEASPTLPPPGGIVGGPPGGAGRRGGRCSATRAASVRSSPRRLAGMVFRAPTEQGRRRRCWRHGRLGRAAAVVGDDLPAGPPACASRRSTSCSPSDEHAARSRAGRARRRPRRGPAR